MPRLKRVKAVTYRNTDDGRLAHRPAGPDKWLDASPVWEPIPAAELEAQDKDERTED